MPPAWPVIACLLFLQTATFAQLPDFAPVGAKWYYSEQAFIPPPYGSYPHVVAVESKEIYQGKLCSKLVRLVGEASPTVPDPLYVYSQNDSVFFYSLKTNRFQLLYDFTAEAGATWVIGGLRKPYGYDSVTVHIDSVSHITVSGTTLKVMHLSCPFLFFDWGCSIIAGIGNPYFITPDYGLYEGGPDGLRCYTDSTTELHFVPYPCDTTLVISGTQDLNHSAGISVFPNPVHDQLHILLEADGTTEATFRLYDPLGRPIRQQPLQVGTTTLDMEPVKTGLHYWEIKSGVRTLKTGYLVKIAD